MNSKSLSMTLIELYQSQKTESASREDARALLKQTHWFTLNAEFDPKTGESLPQALSAFLAKAARPATDGAIRDRLWRIAEHSRASVERLFRALNASPRREQALLPVRAVRELDANSFIKLSHRPGRTIREKLAGKPYLQAVRRFQSVNLPENRLLKAFATRLAELLELRRDCLSQKEDALLPKIESWLLSDEAGAIDRWDNLPPNNTLLSHRDYRRVWDAWRWLQTLDDDIARDFTQLESREKTMRLWNKYAQMWVDGCHRFAEMPVLFDYETFEIRPWLSQLAVEEAPRKITRNLSAKKTLEPVCVDLTVLRPRFGTATESFQALPNTYFWQHWKNDDESVDIELFNSDAVYLHPDVTSISSSDLFFPKDNTFEHFDRAARAFASKLRDVFKGDTLIWLIPDFLNDFELEITRRNLNACFPDAEPLPRSVAAAFEYVDYSKISGDGFPIVVVDTIGGKTCVTKLLARLDPEIKERLPATRGFYWERCPPVIIDREDSESADGQDYDLITVDDNGQWRDAPGPAKPQFIAQYSLKSDSRVGQFAFCINLTKSPVVGGIRLHVLQQRSGDIPLWRDQIPELAIKVIKDGRYQRFHLVSRGTTVKPIRGLAIPIPIDEDFTLPAGKQFYQFPLFQGENADELGFSARVDSHAFPLKEDVVCKLNLTFEYGADEPYKLVFSPVDNSFPPVNATWRRMTEEIVTNAPAPEYPAPMIWDDLKHWTDAQGRPVDLLEWVARRISKLRKTAEGWQDQDEAENEERTFWNVSARAIVNRVGIIWADARSVTDIATPPKFRSQSESGIRFLVDLLSKSQRIAVCVLQILACMHKDMPVECVQWITEQVEHDSISDPQIVNPRAVGFALGDVSEEWQQYIFNILASKPEKAAISVFAYAIWREQHFVERFSTSGLQAVLRALSKRLGNINSVAASELRDSSTRRDWGRATAETLELLLGLLRTRASANPEIRMLLQPHQKTTKKLAKQVERVTELVAESKVPLFSRVQINLQKSESDRTPDLLYALRLYLTGDDGAHAIHVASISDTDDE